MSIDKRQMFKWIKNHTANNFFHELGKLSEQIIIFNYLFAKNTSLENY